MSKIPSRRVSSPFFIGLFVIVGTLLLLGTIIWLGASKFLKENTYYVTYFDTSVEGLETGSPVKYQGVPVGTVSKINVAPDGKLIEVVMQIDKTIEVDPKLRVKAELAGIAGGKFLQLQYPKKPELAQMHPKLNFQPPYKLIESAPSGIDEIEIAMRDVVNNLKEFKVGEISDEAIKFLRTSTAFFENKDLYDIVANLNQSSLRLQSLMAKADTSDILPNLNFASKRIMDASGKFDMFATNLNNQFDNMQLSRKFDYTFSRLDTTFSNANKVINLIGYRAGTFLYGMNEAIEDIKTTNKQLRKSLRAISDNPTQVFFSEPPPKEK